MGAVARQSVLLCVFYFLDLIDSKLFLVLQLEDIEINDCIKTALAFDKTLNDFVNTVLPLNGVRQFLEW
ncbi:unnamed protein product [Dracunculus medinensis]|uniref:Secreted protein n=1 Tax=Dracunculus medinensis TaxID=318479 RepID=A0A0N4U116_DRAME|nr:unnamed protein product [Dracunculus medinensis]